jgi:hypothetical protein
MPTISPEVTAIIGAVINALLPLIVSAIEKGQNPLDVLLHESVAATVPEPLRLQVVLAAVALADARKAAAAK